MTRREMLLALAECVEALAGPDGEVDRLISHHVVFWPQPDFHLALSLRDEWTVDCYTASIDAAASLVPAGWHLSTAYQCLPYRNNYHVRLASHDNRVTSVAATEPNARTAAALRARADAWRPHSARLAPTAEAADNNDEDACDE